MPIKGVRLSVARAGIRKRDRDDICLLELAEGSKVAGVFTRNRFCAAPVLVARDHLENGAPRALVINSGNANAGTGLQGEADARAVCAALGKILGIDSRAVLPFSTGVIGQRLPVEKIDAILPVCVGGLRDDNWPQAAAAIMTTDTIAKGYSATVPLAGTQVAVTGIAKGAGMIRPDMATMLAFVATDAMVTDTALREMLKRAVSSSFNRITIDGDTSTNDACILIATGAAGNAPIDDPDGADGILLSSAIDEGFGKRAQAIVRDGEGATKFVVIKVTGGVSEEDCSLVAYTVAHSPLVKTALFASDANWGRILAAVGRAPLSQIDMSKVSLSLNDCAVWTMGEPASDYSDERGQAVMSQSEIEIHIDLGLGNAESTVWTTDLSHDYVQINAEYRT